MKRGGEFSLEMLDKESLMYAQSFKVFLPQPYASIANTEQKLHSAQNGHKESWSETCSFC